MKNKKNKNKNEKEKEEERKKKKNKKRRRRRREVEWLFAYSRPSPLQCLIVCERWRVMDCMTLAVRPMAFNLSAQQQSTNKQSSRTTKYMYVPDDELQISRHLPSNAQSVINWFS